MRTKTRRQAFTLFEVILAVLIIAMIAVSVQRFVSATLTAISVATERQQDVEAMNALFRYVDAQLDELPLRGPSLIMGYAHQYGDQISDELQWRCQAGSGTLTGAAEGEWIVSLMLRQRTDDYRKYDLGIRRRPANGSNEKEWNWVPLVRDVAMLKFEYFDARLNAWIGERWNDQNAKPMLVRMQVWRSKDSVPEIAVFNINSSMIQQ